MAKSPCPLTRKEFLAQAKPITLNIAGSEVTAEPREFSTGSFGWYFSGKVTVEVGGKRLPLQVGCNLTAVGSKESPK